MAHGLRSLHEIELHLEVVLAQVPERDAELLEATNVFNRQWDNLLLRAIAADLRPDSLLAGEFWDLDLTREQNLQPLDLRSLPTILKEVFHAAIEFGLEELLETVRGSKLFVGIGQKADIDD